MTIKPTAVEAIAEGQLLDAYFPNCADHAAVSTFVDARITSADVRVQRLVGSYYTSADTNVQQELHDAVLYFALAKLWQNILNVMLGYDAEALPPEFVEPDAAAATRDFYLKEAFDIVSAYAADSTPTSDYTIDSYVGVIDSTGYVVDATTIEDNAVGFGPA